MADSVEKNTYCKRFEEFLTFTDDERVRAENRRDYRDLKQWTEDEARTLEARSQAPIVIDFFSKKIDALVGVEIDRRTDPKAYPRTPDHEDAADAITDALRYVEESTQFDAMGSEVFEEKIVEGYAGVLVDVVKNRKGEYDIDISIAHWDRVYFDPHSREKNFSDSTYFGITTWMDADSAKDLFPDAETDIDNLISNSALSGTTFDDRPNNWVDSARKRIRVNQEWYLENGQWMVVYFCNETVLIDPAMSPHLDADGMPCCPLELQSDFVDRDNNRYGYSERFMDSQKEVNHRRSKGLYMLSSASVIAEDGAVKDKEAAQRELRKAQGWLTVTPNKRFEIDRNIEMGSAQLEFYREAKMEIESGGVNPELAGRGESGASGRALIARKQGGLTELAHIYTRHSEWKNRVYRQMWARIKQYWTEEKWIRITDSEDSLQWVGLNIPVTQIEQIVEQKTGMPLAQIRKKYGAEMQQAIQQDPRLGQVVEHRHNVAEIDVDIIIDEAPDTITIQQEQFEALTQLLSANIPPQMFKAVLELSSIRNKKKVIDMLEGDERAQAEKAKQAQQQQEIAQRGAMAEISETESKAALNKASAIDKMASAQQRSQPDIQQPTLPPPVTPHDEALVAKDYADARKTHAEAESIELDNAGNQLVLMHLQDAAI